jgi:hypothetical protein
MIKIGTSDVVV